MDYLPLGCKIMMFVSLPGKIFSTMLLTVNKIHILIKTIWAYTLSVHEEEMWHGKLRMLGGGGDIFTSPSLKYVKKKANERQNCMFSS